MLKIIRLTLGAIIAFFDLITRGFKKKRTPENQLQIQQQLKKLSLYQFNLCPFCIKVRRQLHKLNLPIELRDAKNNPQHRTTLEQEGGRIKVPCLRIEDESGTRWMYESSDIIRYLKAQFN